MVVLLGGLIPAAMIAIPVYVIEAQGVVTGLSLDIVIAAAATTVRFVLIMAFLRAALSPGQPQWRLLDVSNDSAAATYRRAFVLMAIVQIGVFLN